MRIHVEYLEFDYIFKVTFFAKTCQQVLYLTRDECKQLGLEKEVQKAL